MKIPDRCFSKTEMRSLREIEHDSSLRNREKGRLVNNDVKPCFESRAAPFEMKAIRQGNVRYRGGKLFQRGGISSKDSSTLFGWEYVGGDFTARCQMDEPNLGQIRECVENAPARDARRSQNQNVQISQTAGRQEMRPRASILK